MTEQTELDELRAALSEARVLVGYIEGMSVRDADPGSGYFHCLYCDPNEDRVVRGSFDAYVHDDPDCPVLRARTWLAANTPPDAP